MLLILFPLGGVILRIAVKMAGEEKAVKCDLTELDDSILETPAYALENSAKAVFKLMDMHRADIDLAADIFIDRNFEKISEFQAVSADIDRANLTVRSFLTRLYNENLSEAENLSVATLLHNLTSLERISNHTKGVVKQAEQLRDSKLEYSETASQMLRSIIEKTTKCYNSTVNAISSSSNETNYIELAVHGAEEIQALREDYKAGHIERVSSGAYNVQSGIVFMEVVRHMSRIASHSKSVAETASSEDK
jgi:phosphate:Na+ symporter